MSTNESPVTVQPAPEPPPAKRKGGLFRKVVLGAALVLVAGVAVGRMMLPGIIKGAVEQRAPEVLGVPVTLDGVGLSLFAGSVELQGFSIAQPAGFGDEPLYSVKRIYANIDPSALLAGAIDINEVTIDSPHVTVVRAADGRLNYAVIQENVKKWQAAQATTAPAAQEPKPAQGEPAAERRAVSLDEYTVTDLRVALRDLGDNSAIVVANEKLEVKDVRIDPASTEPAWFTMTNTGFKVSGPGGPFGDVAPLSVGGLTMQLDLTALMAGNVSLRAGKVTAPVVRLTKVGDQSNVLALAEVGRRFAPPPVTEEKATDAADSGAAKDPKKAGTVEIADFAVEGFDLSMRDGDKGAIGMTNQSVALKDVRIDAASQEPAWFSIEQAGFALTGPGGPYTETTPFSLGGMSMELDLAALMRGDVHLRKGVVTAPVIRREKIGEAENFLAIAEVAKSFAPPEKPATDASGAPTKPSTGQAPANRGSVLVEYFEVAGSELHSVEKTNSGGVSRQLKVTGISVDARDITMPQDEAKPSQVAIRAHPLSPDAKVAVKLLGNLNTTDAARRNINYEFTMSGLPMAEVSRLGPPDAKVRFKGGQLDTDVKGSLASQVVKADVKIGGRNLELERREGGNIFKAATDPATLVGGAINALEKPGTEELTPLEFPVNVNLNSRDYVSQGRQIATAIADGLMKALQNAMTGQIKNVGEQAGKVVDKIDEQVKGTVQGASDAVKDAGGKVGGAIEDATGAIGGLLGGGRKKGS